MDMVAELDAGLSGLEQLQALLDAGGQPPIGQTLDIALVEIGEGRAVFEGHPSLKVYNPIGMVHGGYAATMLDSACGCAVHSTMKPGETYSTLELKVAYHRPITSETGPVRAEGRVLSRGRRAAFTEATLKDTAGRLLGSATSTLMIMQG
jgi:uncharacterized protein (TIGR00369 family)